MDWRLKIYANEFPDGHKLDDEKLTKIFLEINDELWHRDGGRFITLQDRSCRISGDDVRLKHYYLSRLRYKVPAYTQTDSQQTLLAMADLDKVSAGHYALQDVQPGLYLDRPEEEAEQTPEKLFGAQSIESVNMVELLKDSRQEDEVMRDRPGTQSKRKILFHLQKDCNH